MTTLADKRDTIIAEGGSIPDRLAFGVAAGEKLYQGSMVFLNSSGYLTKTPAAGLVAMGRVNGNAATGQPGNVDNTSGSAGDLTAEVQRGRIPWDNSATVDAITNADRGNICYAVDDHTVARTSNAGQRAIAGIVETVDSDGQVHVLVGSYLGKSENVDLLVLAGADLSAKQGYIVKIDSSGTAQLAGAGDIAAGVLVNAPTSGLMARIRVSGIGLVITATTTAAGSLMAPDTNGKAKAAVLGTVSGSNVVGSNAIGILLATGVVDALKPILINPRGVSPTTTA